MNLQNEKTVDNKGLHKADQISNNTLNFPLCNSPPLLPSTPRPPLIQTFRLIKAAQVCLALFQPNVSNFRSLLHYSSSSFSLSLPLPLLVVFLPYTRPFSLVLITLMSPGINFWARTRTPGARLYFRGIWSIRHDAPSSPRFFFFPLSIPLPPFFSINREAIIEKLSKSDKYIRKEYILSFRNVIINLFWYSILRGINQYGGGVEWYLRSVGWGEQISKFFRSSIPHHVY